MPSSTTRMTAARRRNDRRTRFTEIDVLEGRRLMTAVPYTAPVNLVSQNWANVTVPTTPMYDTPIAGVMPPLSTPSGYVYGDRFQFHLQKGEIVDLSVSAQTALTRGNQPFLIGVADASSVSIYQMSNGVAGAQVAGTSGNTPDVVFEAPATGFYQASVHVAGVNGGPMYGYDSPALEGYYTAHLRPIALDPTSDTQLDPNHNAADAAKLDFQGGSLYAWLNGRSATVNANGQTTVGTTGSSLSFSGPTGRGFTIDGQWTESRNPTTGVVTYTGTGKGGGIGLDSDLTLEMANPVAPTQTLRIPISLGSATGLVVTVGQDSTSDAQGLYGPVTGTHFSVANVPFASQAGSNSNLSGVISSIAGAFGESADLSRYGASLTASNNLNWGVALGSDATQYTDDLPANAAVPYVWFAADAGSQVGAKFGNISASAGQGLGVSALIDPADPSFCLAVTGLPTVPKLGVGGSINGLIPYAPNNQAMPATPLFGDVFFAGSLDLGSLTDETVPLILDGDVTLELDPHHYGLNRIAGGLKADFDTMLTHGSGSPLTAAGINMLKNDLEQVSLGLNGTASLGITAKGVDFELPLGYGSVEWNGITGDLAFAAGTINPLAGTPVSFLTSASSLTASGDINFGTRRFDVDLDGSFGMLGQTLANADVNFAGTYGTGGYAVFTVTGTSHVSIGFGSISTAGAWADAYEQLSFSVDTAGSSSLSASGSATATAALAGHTASGGYSYGWSGTGNIEALIQSQYRNIVGTLSSWDSSLEDYVTNAYYSAKSKVESAWDSLEDWFDSL